MAVAAPPPWAVPYPPVGAGYPSPSPYGCGPPVYFPAAPAPMSAPYPFPFPSLSPARPWPTRSGLSGLESAALLGIGLFALIALVRLVEAGTGISDAPGGANTHSLGYSAIAVLLFGAKGLLALLALAAGAVGLCQLYKGRRDVGYPDPRAWRIAALLLALAVALAASASLGGWAYQETVRTALPGGGTGSDSGVARLWENYRLATAAGSAAGLAAAFALVKGLELACARFSPRLPRKTFRSFALLFVLSFALNAALVLVVYFLIQSPPTVAAPASPAFAAGLLALPPAVAALSLVKLRAFLADARQEADRLAREKPEAAARPA